MTFSGRLRLTLIAAALFPTVLITVIVVLGIGSQLKQLGLEDARAALDRFDNLHTETRSQIAQILEYIAGDREFALMEMQRSTKPSVVRRYALPKLSLDFVEYTDTAGTVLLSADRPAMVGRRLSDVPAGISTGFSHTIENDLTGPHPALTVTVPTQAGYLHGGYFLDRSLMDVFAAMLRAEVRWSQRSADAAGRNTSVLETDSERLYRSGGDLQARLINDPASEYYLTAKFKPVDRGELATNFITAVGAVAAVSLLLVIPAGLVFSSQTRRKIDNLMAAAERVAEGDYSQFVVEPDTGEFGHLADSFNIMMKRIDAFQNRLITSEKIAAWQTIGRKIAHEVKNPLTPIAIASEDIHRSYHERADDFEAILNSGSKTIVSEVKRLQTLLGEFSDFARMPTPKIDRVEIEDIIGDLDVIFAHDREHQRLVWTIEQGLSHLTADPDQIRQLLINLIKNARESGASQVEVILTQKTEKVVMTVTDNGPGFPEALLKDGIMPYYSTKAGGSGLGLVICQRIVIDHGGTMRIENSPSGGGMIVIILPNAYA